MWILFARAPGPDAAYWPGRRWLAALDAIVWPAGWVMTVAYAPATGLVGLVAAAVAMLCAIGRVRRALWHNERYRFTTWRWGVPLATMVLLAVVIKLVA